MADKTPYEVCISIYIVKITSFYCKTKKILLFFIFTQRRLLKELQLFVSEPPQGMFVDADQAEQNLKM